jgi:protein-disulfide isomerase
VKLALVAALALIALASATSNVVASPRAPAAGSRGVGQSASRGATGRAVPPSFPAAAATVRAELQGIPQNGLVLGDGSARVTVFEYADLICPSCARAASAIIAPVIKRFVRERKVSIQFEPIVESPRSEAFALGVFAAGVQHHAWDYAQLAYLRSVPAGNGPPGTPLRLAAALGLNLHRWRSCLPRRQWPRVIEQAAKVALIGGFTDYPVFIVRATAYVFGRRTHSISVLRAPVTLAQLSATVRRALQYSAS